MLDEAFMSLAIEDKLECPPQGLVGVASNVTGQLVVEVVGGMGRPVRTEARASEILALALSYVYSYLKERQYRLP